MDLANAKRELSIPLKKREFMCVKNCFYFIKNDLAFCLSLDQPGGLLYCTFHVIPLYLPCQTRYYTYGNRLNNFNGSAVKVLKKNASLEEDNTWLYNVQAELELEIFPFFNRISSPLGLLALLEQGHATVSRYFFCAADHLDRLAVFTYLYLGDFPKLQPAIEQAYRSLEGASYTPQIKNARHAELQEIIRLSAQNNFDSAKYCADIIEKTRAICFHGPGRKT